ncbi:MAG: hypothetical protein A3I05_01320 [Deltaproteobacteria bacterium RIFCSPLOWO2_02_FULL_44_10]|nr:MAG: hypothetical protein A3C46_00730 [Deltaproteobacteria bacterium RIFCSPHIGHO2_02_FULL_44_16]OGQ46957.1 MAG: hypothetical protein A3I05_01320 [Deltaproteobacteria bacterium RIFCSPLOWO2_02_FULL_44_10]
MGRTFVALVVRVKRAKKYFDFKWLISTIEELVIENGRRRRLSSGVFRRWKRSLNAQQAEAQGKIRRVRIFSVVRQCLRETFSTEQLFILRRNDVRK